MSFSADFLLLEDIYLTKLELTVALNGCWLNCLLSSCPNNRTVALELIFVTSAKYILKRCWNWPWKYHPRISLWIKEGSCIFDETLTRSKSKDLWIAATCSGNAPSAFAIKKALIWLSSHFTRPLRVFFSKPWALHWENTRNVPLLLPFHVADERIENHAALFQFYFFWHS